jgi:hypothetical protein
LDDQGLIKRTRGLWTLTKSGRQRVEHEETEFSLSENEPPSETQTTHQTIQIQLVEIGQILGFHAETEFEYYDVIWRERPNSPRLSHVFEVQHKGNIDSAFAKLKRAFQAQRSKPFLILDSERDTNRALRSISYEQTGAFHELGEVLTILSFEQIRQLHRSLKTVADVLPFFLTQ